MDTVRIIRALEVISLAGRPFSEVIEEHRFSDRKFSPLTLCLSVDRDVLYDRINTRALSMIDAGLVGEVEGLLATGYGPELKPMKAIGYRHMVGYLRGDWDLDEAVRLMQRDTRRYAKRQLTWFRSNQEVVWVTPEDRLEIIDAVRAFIRDTK
jgi:tRNA dimethylallyltransferase